MRRITYHRMTLGGRRHLFPVVEVSPSSEELQVEFCLVPQDKTPFNEQRRIRHELIGKRTTGFVDVSAPGTSEDIDKESATRLRALVDELIELFKLPNAPAPDFDAPNQLIMCVTWLKGQFRLLIRAKVPHGCYDTSKEFKKLAAALFEKPPWG